MDNGNMLNLVVKKVEEDSQDETILGNEAEKGKNLDIPVATIALKEEKEESGIRDHIDTSNRKKIVKLSRDPLLEKAGTPSRDETTGILTTLCHTKVSDELCESIASDGCSCNESSRPDPSVTNSVLEGDVVENALKFVVTTANEGKREKKEIPIKDDTHVNTRAPLSPGAEISATEGTPGAENIKSEDPEAYPLSTKDDAENLSFVSLMAAGHILDNIALVQTSEGGIRSPLLQETVSEAGIVLAETEDMGMISSQNFSPPSEPTKINFSKKLSNEEEEEKDENETASLQAQDSNTCQTNTLTTPEFPAASETANKNEKSPVTTPTLAVTSSSMDNGNMLNLVVKKVEEDSQDETILGNEAEKGKNLDIPVATIALKEEKEESGIRDHIYTAGTKEIVNITSRDSFLEKTGTPSPDETTVILTLCHAKVGDAPYETITSDGCSCNESSRPDPLVTNSVLEGDVVENMPKLAVTIMDKENKEKKESQATGDTNAVSGLKLKFIIFCFM
uniref:Uncharacterized protein n=1 Tax=Corethron hystrix TaxID=216773 RepID=A0A7S1FVT2_9STRA|mmetsp:Transcript_31862/g.73325  ORF Transcript_31862/g.73325 Transcript_31862/m.73325 type:complete len:508 (+) Transcript_31862:43-1566(+)